MVVTTRTISLESVSLRRLIPMTSIVSKDVEIIEAAKREGTRDAGVGTTGWKWSYKLVEAKADGKVGRPAGQ